MEKTFDVLIIGGGSAGVTAAARILRKGHFKTLAVLDPSSTHYYQPLWTLVGGGLVNKVITAKPMKSVLPQGACWIQEKAIELIPRENKVRTEKSEFSYKYLIIATGIVPDWTFAEGLKENIGKNNVCSVYDYKYADYTFDVLKNAKSGNMIYTMPTGLLKCGGAPQKIMWLSEDYCQRFKKRSSFSFNFNKEGDGIFGVEKYRLVLEKLVQERNIHTHYHQKLINVDGLHRKATFKHLQSGEETTTSYEMLHVSPHFHTHEFIAKSELANEKGEISVDAKTLQSTHYKNIFSLGDCSSCPTGKTGAGIRKQAPVLVDNLISQDTGHPLDKEYNGYTACPILTRHNRVILCEFDYDGNPTESFPFNQARERYSMFLFKRYLLPEIYWKLMLKGLA